METLPNNLPTFRILYLVKGILMLVFSVFPLLYAGMGVFIGNIDEFNYGPDAPPFNVGLIFIIIGVFFFIMVIIMGILSILASQYLKEVKNYNFIFVVAVLSCFTGILGILLGVFTIIELNKPHVKEMFGKS